jgi:hypothetical protein
MKKREAEGDDVIDGDGNNIYETATNELEEFEMSTCPVYDTVK